MGTILVSSAIAKVQTILQDPTGVRWPGSELLGWLNDGQREVVLYRPQASVRNEAIALTPGKTKQAIPSGGVQMLDVVRNMGSDGNTPGDSIRVVSRDVLDAQLPTWHSEANSVGKIRHFMFDPRDPKTFYVYPKSPNSSLYVDIVYSVSPTDCTMDGVIQIDDIYTNALVDYVVYRAYSKDAEYAANTELAKAHYAAFANSIGVKTGVESALNPTALAQPKNKAA